MRFQDGLVQILKHMWTRKLRSALALFGIVWGTLSVVVLLALGHGFYQANMKSMKSLTSGMVIVNIGSTSINYQGYPIGRPLNIKTAAIMRLKKEVAGIKSISPMLSASADLSYADRNKKTEIMGSTASLASILNLKAKDGGSFFSTINTVRHQHVVFLGHHLAQQLFQQQNPVGRYMNINQVPFKVVGIGESKQQDSGGSNWNQNLAFIPYTSYIDLFGNAKVFTFYVKPMRESDMHWLGVKIRRFLAYQYHFSPNDTQAIHIPNIGQFLMFIIWFFRAIEIFLGFCGAVTLAVGGIGVANIMFLIVTERTREIGLLMALGATHRSIMLQVMGEALVIVALGAAVALLLSVMLVALLSLIHLPSWLGHPAIDWTNVGVTSLILLMLALLAGYFPARRASRLQPVEALSF